MSVRYEAIDARYATVSVAQEGEELGEDLVGDGKMALVISYDEVVYIEGTRLELLQLIANMLTVVADEVG